MPFWRTYRKWERRAYLLNRTVLDVDAARRGPAVLAKRLLRRRLTRAAFRLFR